MSIIDSLREFIKEFIPLDLSFWLEFIIFLVIIFLPFHLALLEEPPIKIPEICIVVSGIFYRFFFYCYFPATHEGRDL